jgi:hypothetical protein
MAYKASTSDEAKKLILLLMKEQGLNKADLAGRMGVTRNAVHYVFKRERCMLETFQKLLDALGYDAVLSVRERPDERANV